MSDQLFVPLVVGVPWLLLVAVMVLYPIQFARFICLFEGPMGTAAFLAVVTQQGPLSRHPIITGALIFPALVWMIVGWYMTVALGIAGLEDPTRVGGRL